MLMAEKWLRASAAIEAINESRSELALEIADIIDAEIAKARLGNGYVPASNFQKIARKLRRFAARRAEQSKTAGN
jgi:hypothetical protein